MGSKKIIFDPPVVFKGVSYDTISDLTKASGLDRSTLREHYNNGKLLERLKLLEQNKPVTRFQKIDPPLVIKNIHFYTVPEISEYTGLPIMELRKRLKKGRDELFIYVISKINCPEYTGNVKPIQDYNGKWWPSKGCMAENYPVGSLGLLTRRLNKGQPLETALNTPPKEHNKIVQDNDEGRCVDPWGNIWRDSDEMCLNYPVQDPTVYANRMYSGYTRESALLTPVKVMPELNFLTIDGREINTYTELAFVLNVNRGTAKKLFLSMTSQELQALIYRNEGYKTRRVYDHLGQTYKDSKERLEKYSSTIAGDRSKAKYAHYQNI